MDCGGMDFCASEKSILCGVLYDVDCGIMEVCPMLHEGKCYLERPVWTLRFQVLCHNSNGMGRVAL